MNAGRSVRGWWVLCLMAGLGAQPLFAVESGEVSRAVEVAPPKGWTPDTPLFHDESTTFSREAERGGPREAGVAHAPKPARPAHSLNSGVTEAPSAVRRTRKSEQVARFASASALLKEARVAKANGAKVAPVGKVSDRRKARLDVSQRSRESMRGRVKTVQGQAGGRPSVRARSARGADKSVTSRTRTAAAKRGTGSTAHQPGARQGERSASPARLVPAARQPAGGVARSAKARRVESSATGPRRRAAPRKLAAQGDGKMAQRSAKRVAPGAQTGGRAGSSAGVKKG